MLLQGSKTPCILFSSQILGPHPEVPPLILPQGVPCSIDNQLSSTSSFSSALLVKAHLSQLQAFLHLFPSICPWLWPIAEWDRGILDPPPSTLPQLYPPQPTATKQGLCLYLHSPWAFPPLSPHPFLDLLTGGEALGGGSEGAPAAPQVLLTWSTITDSSVGP